MSFPFGVLVENTQERKLQEFDGKCVKVTEIFVIFQSGFDVVKVPKSGLIDIGVKYVEIYAWYHLVFDGTNVKEIKKIEEEKKAVEL